MCIGVLSGTAETIFGKMHEVFESNDISWSKCIGLSVDNTSVNIGKHNSIMTRVLQKNPAIYINGCPCHIVHNMMQKASTAFTQVQIIAIQLPCTIGDVEEIVVDIFYHFSSSTKRKSGLEEYCNFCDIEYRKILKHINVRWLSLEAAVHRILQQYPWVGEWVGKPKAGRGV